MRVSYWSNEADDTLQIVFDRAYADFKTWLKVQRISCSQPHFRTWMDFWRGTFQFNMQCSYWSSSCRAQVYKKTGEVAFTTKTYNGRVVSEWLWACLENAAGRLVDPDGQLPLILSCLIFGHTEIGVISIRVTASTT